jgi:hypothetical protein
MTTVKFLNRGRIFLFASMIQVDPGMQPSFCSEHIGFFFRVGKWLKCEVEHSVPYYVEV